MCRNHSHLIARYLGEDIGGDLPALMFQLEKNVLSVEQKGGSALIIPTSGLVYVPVFLLGGLSALPSPPMGALSMSVFFMPDGARTGILDHVAKWLLSQGILQPLPAGTGTYRNEEIHAAARLDPDPLDLGGVPW